MSIINFSPRISKPFLLYWGSDPKSLFMCRLSFCALLFGILLLHACGGGRAISYSDSQEELAELLTGSFTSETQAEQDSLYSPVHLHIVQVWKDRAGQWFYVEQALAAQDDKPYRQRMYRVVQLSSERFKILNYEFRNPQVFAGKWKDPQFFDDYPEEIVAIKEGCGVFLHRKAFKHYEGETYGEDCFSQFQGAQYATSEVEIRSDLIKSWDRGWTEEEEQVWGPEDGPYRFERMGASTEESEEELK